MKTLERRGEDWKYRLFNGTAGHFYNLLSVVLEYFVSICRVIFQSDRSLSLFSTTTTTTTVV